MKDGAARNAPRFHRRFACHSARLGGKPRNRESGEDPTCGAATAAASPAPPPIPRQRNETPAGAPGLSTCSPTPPATARLRCHAATCSSARTLSRSHHRTSASALHGRDPGPSPHSGRPSCCASMGEVTKKGKAHLGGSRASVASSTDRARRRRARGVQQSHETVDMMPSPTETAASPSPSPSAPRLRRLRTRHPRPRQEMTRCRSVDPPHVVKLPWHLKLSPNLTPRRQTRSCALGCKWRSSTPRA